MSSSSQGRRAANGKRLWTPEERQELLKRFRASGKSQSEFVREHGIPQATFSAWSLADQKGRKGKARKPKGRKPGPYTPEQRRQAVEAYLKSGMSLKDFGKVWGISGPSTLQVWVKIYQEKGPKGLEAGIYGKGTKPRGRKPLAQPVRREIVAAKLENPDHGFKKISNFLWRFRGVKVSTGSVRKTLKQENLPPAPRPRKKPKRHPKVRRFERARAMQLWQSDITSYVMTRHSARVYLTVFMDDYSRYIVSWNLALRQTTEFVVEALQDGIQRFGKPEEVLTDQGRQYYSWRGRSDFQKTLDKAGVHHIKSRTHHPQTLGKCERFWETVREEFWDRVKPQDLTDAKERFKHFVAHYNHFRPHQGIDGLVPADRFFGLESEVRKAIEATLAQNELRLALGEAPRAPVFLVGQIGGQSVSLHGEGGKLVVQMPDGLKKALEYREFGHAKQKEEERDDERSHQESGRGHDNPAEAQARGTAEGIQDAQARDPREGLVGASHPGAAGESTQPSHRDHGILDGSDDQGRGSQAAQPAHTSSLAVIPAGDFGYGGGTAAPTQGAPQGDDDGEQGRRPEVPQEADCGARADDRDPGPADCGPSRDAGLPGRLDSHASDDDCGGGEECEAQGQGEEDTDGSSQ